mgnify:CR=1 FL=1
MGKTSLGNLFRWWQLPPERLADKDDPSSTQALRQKLDSAGDTPCDPGGTDTSCHADLFVRDIARRIAMDELDSIGNAKLYGTAFRLLGEQLAHVDTGADDAVIACPGTKHLPRTAAEVEHSAPRFQTQRRAESGELFWSKRVVDAVSTFSDVKIRGISISENFLTCVN